VTGTHPEHQSVLDQVALTSDGSILRPSSMVRRQDEEELLERDNQKLAALQGHHHEHRHRHHAAHEKQASYLATSPDGGDDSWVTCGGHKAPTCAACVSTDSEGRTVFDHGSEWCHGDCVYHPNKCHKSGTVVVDGTSKGVARGYDTTPLPDLLNPVLSADDQRTIDNAAEAAVREENIEAAQTARDEEEAIESKKFSWSKFWLITCVTISVILGICACVSVCVLVVYFFMPTPGPPKGQEDDDSEDEDGEVKTGGTADDKAAKAAAEAPAEVKAATTEAPKPDPF
jgi:hypothetical protein